MASLSWTVYVRTSLHNTQLLECQTRHSTRTLPNKAADRLQKRAKTLVCRMSCKPGCMLHLIFCSRNCINIEMISDQRSQSGSEKITQNYLKVQHYLTCILIAITQLKVPPLSEFKRNEIENWRCTNSHHVGVL